MISFSYVWVIVLACLVTIVTSQVTVKLLDTNIFVDEGDQFKIRVQKSGQLSDELVVIIQIQDDIGDDFIGDTQVATFTPTGPDTATVIFTVRDDNLAEGNEVHILLISIVGRAAIAVDPSQTRVTIRANDDAYGIFSFNLTSPMLVREETFTSIVNLKISRARGDFERVTVSYMVNGSSAEADIDRDISPNSGIVRFEANEKEHNLQLQIRADTIPENAETFKVYLVQTSPPAGIDIDEITLVIQANDAPLGFSSPEYRYKEGPGRQTYTVTVHRGLATDGFTRIGSVTEAATVQYSVFQQSATFNVDFMSSNGQLSFGPGETVKTIEFQILDDSDPEMDEAFQVNLSSPTGDVVWARNLQTTTVVISANDNPSGVISFQTKDSTTINPEIQIDEDRYTVVSFTVVRNAGLFGSVRVTWEVDHYNTSSDQVTSDVGPLGGEILFQDGVNVSQITLTIVQDPYPEPAEKFVVRLLDATGNAKVDGVTEAFLLIEDSDDMYGRIEFDSLFQQTIVTTPTSRSLQLQLKREGGRSETLIANISLSYFDNSNTERTADVLDKDYYEMTLRQGMNIITDRVPLLSAAFLQTGGSFIARIIDIVLETPPAFGAFNSPFLETRNQVTIPVTATDANGEIGFESTNEVTVSEPESGNLPVRLKITREGSSGMVDIRWRLTAVGDGAAYVTNTDFATMTGTVTMQSGVSAVDLTIFVQADNVPEVDEMVTVTLEVVDATVTQRLRPGSSEVNVTILSNDNPAGVFEFSPLMSANYSIEEGSQAVTIIVVRSGGSLTTKEVRYQVEPQGDTEFYGGTNVLRFEPGETTVTATLVARSDGVPELAESFTLRLFSYGTPPSVLGTRTSIPIVIVKNDDPHGVIQFSMDPTVVYMGESTESNPVYRDLIVQRSRGTFGIVSVSWFLSLNAQDDLTPTTGQVTFPEGTAQQTIRIQSVADNIPESDERYILELSPPDGGAVPGIPTKADIIIRENDHPVELTETMLYQLEPSQVFFTIVRRGRLTDTTRVRYRTLDASASELTGDYTQVNQEMVFEPGVSQKSFSVNILNDDLPEGNETFTVQLYDLGGDFILTNKSTATVVILANDDAYGLFRFQDPLQRDASEGETIYFNIVRNKGSFGEVDVSWQIRDMLTNQVVSGTDEFNQTSGTVKFLPGQAQLPVTIQPLADNVPENDKSYEVVLTGVSVVSGRTDVVLARLDTVGTVATLTVKQSDEPYGKFAFPATSDEMTVAEDYAPGAISTSRATFTVERQQGVLGSTQVLWEVYGKQMGGNPPKLVDLTFVGTRPSTMTNAVNKQRPGTRTEVYLFTGSPGSFMTVSQPDQPLPEDIVNGFSLSAWVQPMSNPSSPNGGYILSKTSADGLQHYYSLRLKTTPTLATIELTLARSNDGSQNLPAVTNVNLQDGEWHHIMVSVANGTSWMYLDGVLISTRALIQPDLIDQPGVLMVGARAPAEELYRGYLQDVRVFLRSLVAEEVLEIYETPARMDVVPISGILTYSPGLRTGQFSIQSIQDIEEEGNEVFSVTLISVNGGAVISDTGRIATLTVLKSDNANGLFGFQQSCQPSQTGDESAMITCIVGRTRGDGGTVTVTWVIQQDTNTGYVQAVDDFVQYTGALLFGPGVREQTLEFQVKEENLPEKAEIFRVLLSAAISDDGITGSTNQSGASIDPVTSTSSLVIDDTDYPHGLLQFSAATTPPTSSDPMITPATGPITVTAREENNVASLLVVRAQGLIGQVSAEWRTTDGTALSEGKTPPDFVGAASRLVLRDNERYAYLNISLIDNNIPEPNKSFSVELVNPIGGASVGPGSIVTVVIEASDGAFGIYQFADDSISVQTEETGDVGFTSVKLNIVRLGGTYGVAQVTWQAADDLSNDLVQTSGTVSFTAGQTSAEADILIRGDTEPELDEQVKIVLTATTEGDLGESLRRTSTVTILANDDPYGMFVIASTLRPVTVREANTDISITIQRLYGKFGTVDASYVSLAPNLTYNYLPGPVNRASYNDFMAAQGTVRFLPNQEFATVSVTIMDDDLPEVDESVFVQLTQTALVQGAQSRAVPNSPRIGPDSQSYAQIIITSNDDASGIVEFSAASLEVQEDAGQLDLYVTRSGGTFGEITVRFRTIDQEARSLQDYIIMGTEVILSDREIRKRIPIVIENDRIPEFTERFTIELLSPVIGGAALGTVHRAVVSIQPSDDPNGAFEFARAGMEVTEPENGQGYPVNITVVRTGGSQDVVTVNWEARLNGDFASDDISPASGSLFFITNEGSRRIQVTILPDDVPEGAEKINLTLTSANNGGRITERNSFILTIAPNDNPHGVVQFLTASYSLPESDQPQFVAVQRVGGTYGRLRIFYTTNQISLSTLAIEAGVSVTSYYDDFQSGRRLDVGSTVDVTTEADPLSTCASACLNVEACVSFVFRNETDPPQCYWYLTDTATLLNDTGSRYYTKNTTKVSVLQEFQARPGDDYTAITQSSVTIEDQVASAQIQVTILDDSQPELEEKFQLKLLRVEVDDPSVATSQSPELGNIRTADIVIPPNDAANGLFRVYSSSPSATTTEVYVEERDRQAVDLIVERTGGTIGAVSVDWSVAPSPTAEYQTDFIADGATLVFAAGQSRTVVTVTVLDDQIPEGNETFTIQLSNPQGGATVGPQSSITVVILENDYVAGILGLDTTAFLATEGDTINVRVSRTAPAQGTVVVNWNIQGRNGIRPENGFRNYNGTLTFTPGEMYQLISLSVLVDDTPEVDEEYQFVLSDPITQGVGWTGAAIVNPQLSTALITISGSDEPHGVFEFASTSRNVRVEEDIGRVNLQVDRKFGVIGVVRVTYSILMVSVTRTSTLLNYATPDLDFGSVGNGYIDVPDGEAAGTIVVDIRNDDIPEIDEVFIVTLNNATLLTGGDNGQKVNITSKNVSEVIISANDGAKGVVMFGQDSRSVTVEELEINITLAVIRDRGTFGNISVFFYSQSLGAKLGTDYNVVSQEIVFTAGENRKDMLVQIHHDNTPEPDEKFEVILANPQDGAAIGTYATATVTILANDNASGIIQLGNNTPVTLREPQGDNLAGSKVEIQLFRGPGIFGVVHVPFVITTPDNSPVIDIVPVSGSIIFEDLVVRSTLELRAVDDNTPEGLETFILTLQNPDNGAKLGTMIQRNINILPNDSPQGLFEIFVANTRNSTTTIEESAGIVYLDIIRSRGAAEMITVDVATVAETALTAETEGGITLALLQSIPSQDVSGWYSFSVKNTVFIIMLTSLPTATTLRSRLPNGPYSGNGQSVLFRWQGEATYMTTVNTNGASAAVSFTLSNETYLMVANAGIEGNRAVDSVLFSVKEDGQISPTQAFRTIGASDVKFVTHDNQNFLLLSNALDSMSQSNLTVDIYIWNTVTRQFGIVPWQSINSLYARAITLFTLDNVLFMAVASYYDWTKSSYETNSVVYKMGTDYRFSQHQALSTKGAVDVEFVDTGTMKLLVFANNRQNVVRSPQQSAIYRYDSATQMFLNHQFLETTRAQSVGSITEGNNIYLAFANTLSSSLVFKWNRDRSVFESVWTGPAQTRLEPIKIQQTSGPLLLLAGAPVEIGQNSVLYQLAEVDVKSDFVPRDVTMTFYPDQTILHTTAVVLQDNLPEDTETFSMTLKNPTDGAEIGLANSVTISILSNDNAHGIIEFSNDSLSVFAEERNGESNPVQLNVVRGAGYFGRVVVRWTATGDHSGTSDITPLQGQVEFANGQALSTITLTVRDDEEAEFAEETYVQLVQVIESGTSLPAKGAILGQQTTSKVTVLANDSPHGVVFWETTLTPTVEPEGTDLTLRLNIKRDQGSEGTIRVLYVTSAASGLPTYQQATAGEDYVSRSGSVTMATGVTTAEVEITIKQDALPEADESFYVNITSVELVDPSGSASSQPSVRVPGSVTQIMITENDNARGLVQFNVTLNVEGRVDTYEEYGSMNTVILPLSRTVGLFGEVMITWRAQPLEANRDDFSPSDGNVRFESGQTMAQIEISIIDDNKTEPMEMFDVQIISVDGGAGIGTPATVRVAILKNDSPTGLFRFSTTEVRTKEAISSVDPDGQATLTVERVQGAQGLVLVEWRLAADAEEDFLPPLQGTLSFNEGEVIKSIVLQTKPDDILEGEEKFVISLTSATNDANIAVKQADATVIVQANEGASGRVAIEMNSRRVYIGEPGESAPNYNGQAEIVLNRGEGIYGPISVTWSLSPRESQAFLQLEGTVNFVDLQQTATVVLEAKDDTDPELRKTYTFVISAATGGAVISPEPGANLAQVVFVASDYPHGRFEFSLPQLVSVDENVGTFTVKVDRQGGNVGRVQVSYVSTPGTALQDQDYFPAAGTLRFENGIRSQEIQVTIIADSIPEGPEQFYLNLTSTQLLNPTNNNYTMLGSLQLDMKPGLGSVDVKTVLIQKNDNAEGTIDFSPEAVRFTVKEEDLTAQVPLVRTGGTYGAVGVRYDVENGTAVRGQDYQGVGGEVIFGDGSSQETINITLLDDAEMEFEETFILTLKTTSGGAQLGSSTTATVTIAKSDFPNGRFGFRGQLDIVMNNTATVKSIPLEIQRTGGLLGRQTVFWRLMGPNNPDAVLDDTSDIIYNDNGREVTLGTLMWADGEGGGKPFTLQVKPYSSWEIEEVFVVTIYNIQGPLGVGDGEPSPTSGEVRITVKKFGNPNGIIGFDGAAQLEREVEEPTDSGTLAINFPLSRRPDTGVVGIVQIFWEVQGPPGMSSDIQPVNGSLYLANQERSGVISLSVLPDEDPELTETFTLSIKRIEGGADIDQAFSQSTFKIRYNDNPHGQFGVVAGNQKISVNPSDLSRRIHLNFTRHYGSFGSTSLEYTVTYDLPQVGIIVSPNTDIVTFQDGDAYATTISTIGGTGFLELGTTFTVSLNRVQFIGPGMTDQPRLQAGETEAKIPVPPPAANSEVGFKDLIVTVNEATRTVLLTVTRRGTYGTIDVDWVSGLLDSAMPAGVEVGDITPSVGSARMTHTLEVKNLTVQVAPQLNRPELFAVRLPGPPKTAVIGGARINADQSVAKIEPHGLIQFHADSLTPDITESNKQVSLTVVRLYGSEGRVEVRYTTEAATAQGNFDYREIKDGFVVMENGVVSSTFTIDIYQDNQPETTEIFYVNLTEVVMYPTPQNPIPSPRLSPMYSRATVSIRESNDPYGVLCLEPWTVTTQERFSIVLLRVERTGGVFGPATVKVRTVGGGEPWTSAIAIQVGATSNNTISEVLGNRDSQSIATVARDYEALDTTVTLQPGETSIQVNVTILDDNLPEPQEVVLVYLTQPEGGARIARGAQDGGKRGFSMITIDANDKSNGRIGFAEDSKLVTADEDTENPTATLTLLRLKPFFGAVTVSWNAKKSQNSNDAADAGLSSQLRSTSGVTECPHGEQRCSLLVPLIDDQVPEEEYTFVVQLVKAEPDAELVQNSLFAIVTIAPSDFVRGQIGFAPASRTVVIGENDKSARLSVERNMGQDYSVEVRYTTLLISTVFQDAGVDIYPALEGEDFQDQAGVLVFQAGRQTPQQIDIELTPVLASDNPLPKQFQIQLKSPTNGSSLHPEYDIANIRIVKQEDVVIWKVIVEGQKTPLTDPNIQTIIGKLDPLVRNDLGDKDITLVQNTLDRITGEGEKRKLPDEVVTTVLNMYCKLLDRAMSDARKGRSSLAKSLERFAYTFIKDESCPDPNVEGLPKLISHQCANVKVSAGRWPINKLQGYQYPGQRFDEFEVPQTIPGLPNTNSECQDFHMIEYNSDQWFRTESAPELLRGKVISFGVKDKPSTYTNSPVKFKIHSPDRRVSTSRAQCVYFDESVTKWTNPDSVCEVTNSAELGTEDFVDCACKHMTSYAVIAKTLDPGLVYYELWFYICCAICMGCLLMVLLLHHICSSQPMISASLFMHLVFAAMITQLCFVLSAYLSRSKVLLVASFSDDNYRCIIMGIFMHYFFIAQFTWIMTQSVNLWKLLVMNDEHTERKFVFFFILGWGLPLFIVGVFYAVVYNLFKYVYSLPVDFIYGDINNNNEMCFITNAYAALGGLIVPALLMLLVVCIIFIKAFQMASQWEQYDDVYRGRYNKMEIKLMLFVWGLLVFTWMWAGLHMVYGQMWMLVLFCIFDLTLGLTIFILYGILRNPCMPYSSTHKASYAVSVGDFDSMPPQSAVPHYQYQQSPGPASFKGSRASLLHEAWEQDSSGPRSQMTVKRALPSQVYINPPISIISPPSHSDMEDRDFDELLYALKAGGSFAPSEVSRSNMGDDVSIQSDRLEHYETKRIDIADTHL